jgi:DNA-binding beta-propeller fold protein YncE
VLKSCGTTRQEKNYKTYRGITKDRDCTVIHTISQKTLTVISNKETVVVVNKSGHHRFSYTGQGSEFYPYGICTDVLGHILVCNSFPFSDGVHLLDQDGQFLSLLLTQQHGVYRPFSVCVDDDNNLYVGQYGTNTVTVYKYLV